MTPERGKRHFVKNRQVQFPIQNVFFPEPAAVLKELHGKTSIEGRVIELSEGGPNGEMFAVVEVEGLSQPVIVPLRCITEKL